MSDSRNVFSIFCSLVFSRWQHSIYYKEIFTEEVLVVLEDGKDEITARDNNNWHFVRCSVAIQSVYLCIFPQPTIFTKYFETT